MSTPETGHNSLLTRDEFLHQILHSGQLTQIAQHIALVVFLVAEGQNQLSLSLRDLERITGWSRRAIKEHLDELDVFMRVTFGSGRGKALFELQGIIENELTKAIATGAIPPQSGAKPPQTRSQPPTSPVEIAQPFVRISPQVPAPGFVGASLATSILAAAAASPAIGSQVPTTAPQPTATVSHPPIKPLDWSQNPTKSLNGSQVPITTLYRERESLIDSNISFSLSSLSHSTPREAADDIQVNGVAILGPNFKVPYAAIDLAAGMIGMPKERARAIAEVCARDWAANGVKPQSPMAVIKRAMKNDFNEGQIQDVRMDKARADAKPKESRAARLLRHVEDAAEKGGRS